MGMHKKIFNTILKSLERGMKLPVNYNTIHSNREIFEILLQTSFLHQFIETTVQQRSYFADDVCSADTVIKRINTYGWERILVDLKVINGQLFKGWIDKPKGNVYVAVDYHDIPRFIQKKRDWKPRKKKCDDVDRIVHSKKQYGTYCFHRVLSADIVGAEKFTVYFEPILTDYDQGKIPLSLIKNVKRTIRIKAMLMDRGFFQAVTVARLYEHHVPFVIRAIRTKQVKRCLQDFKKNHRIWQVYEYEFNKTAHGWSDRRGTRVKTTLVVVDSSVAEGIPVESYDEDDRYFLFITNLPVGSRDTAFQLARDFRKRWCIETGYKTKKQFRGKTCSLSYAVRLFFILLSFVLYNIWICINSTLKHKDQWMQLEKPHVSSYLMMFLCMIHMFSRMIFTEK
jgi:hypothetical protein